MNIYSGRIMRLKLYTGWSKSYHTVNIVNMSLIDGCETQSINLEIFTIIVR